MGILLRTTLFSVALAAGFAALAFADSGSPAAGGKTKGGKFRLYVGTYTGAKSKGIYRFDFDAASGKLTSRELAGEITNPSFLAIHPSHRFLYAVNEVGDFKGKKTGAIAALAIDPDSGNLKLLNQHASGGQGPCYVTLDHEGKHALAANYRSGSAIVVAVRENGYLGEETALVQHKGTGANPQRQEGPHAHSINLDPANRFAFVADLGLDKILIYRYGQKDGTLAANEPPSVSLAPGAGPRHFTFHPNGRYAYVINEMQNTVVAFDYDAENGSLKAVQTISTLPKGFKGESSTAEVQVHPSGKFLYGSNRGHNSIAIFSIDQETGKLTAVGYQAKDIKTPRNFAIDPTGAYLLVANQDSDSIVTFRIDQKTGELEPTGDVVEVPAPVCLKMMPLKP